MSPDAQPSPEDATSGPDAQRPLADRYLLGRRLGRGGMGTVWFARDLMLDRDVAVKELSVRHLSEEDLAVVRSRMQQEARAAARIRHPGVITVHDVLEQDGRPWIVMELVDGRSLAEVVEQEGVLAPREAARIGAQVLAALDQGHRAGVIHRDVKPANVLLERGTGRVVLTDFGIATYEGDSALTRTGDLVGSPDYLAPERVHGGRPGPESDLWGLGATLYAAVEGQSPFRRESPITTLAAVVADPLPEPRNAGPLAPVLRRLLAKDPAERPSAADGVRMLADVAAGREPAAGPEPATVVIPPAQAVTAALPRPDAVPPETVPPDAVSFGSGSSIPGGPAAASGARPEPADPSPTGAHRLGHGRPRRRGRRRVLLGAVAAVVAAAAVAGTLIGLHGGSGHGADAGAASPPPVSAAPSRTALPSPPAGYAWRTDPAGFRFPEPTADGPWHRDGSDSPVTIAYTADGGRRRIAFGLTPAAPRSPLAHARDMAAETRKRLHTYHQVNLAANSFRGATGAQWEFTFGQVFDGKLVEEHEVEQLYRDPATGTEYDFYVAYPEAQWPTGYQRFLTLLRGFQPT